MPCGELVLIVAHPKLMHRQISFVCEVKCFPLDPTTHPHSAHHTFKTPTFDNSSPHTHTHTAGLSTELHGKVGTDVTKFEDILKDLPQKYSLRHEGLRLEPIPPLGVIQNQMRGCGDHHMPAQNRGGRGREGEGERRQSGGYQPGPNEKRSLKRDGNVIPLSAQRTRSSSEGSRGNHRQDFRCVRRIAVLYSRVSWRNTGL